MCDPQLTVVGAVVYHSHGARLFMTQRPPRHSECDEEKKTEHNLHVGLRSGKSEAEVTSNRRLRSTCIALETRSIARPLYDS